MPDITVCLTTIPNRKMDWRANGNGLCDNCLVSDLGPCNEWTGYRTKRGYGQLRRKGQTLYAHREAWKDCYGEIPDGMDVCHRCDNPPCWRIDHLFLGSPSDNNGDMTAKGRHWNQRKTHCKWGHEFAGENLFIDTAGHRQCRTCMRRRAKKQAGRHSAAA